MSGFVEFVIGLGTAALVGIMIAVQGIQFELREARRERERRVP